MSYLYVPGLEGSTSELSLQQAESLAQSVSWKGKLMQPRFWLRAWKKDSWLRRLCGVTSPHSTVASGAESWISSLRDTRASHSLPLASVLELMTQGTSGPMLHESSESAVQDLFSLRTSPAICPSDSTRSAATFKAWATGLRRAYSARRKSAQAIAERGCSSWPTMSVMDAHGARNAQYRTETRRYGDTIVDAVYAWPTPRAGIPGARKPGTGGQVLSEVSQAWPTPTSGCPEGTTPEDGKRRNPRLMDTAVMWKTPTANEDAAGRPGAKMQQQIKQQAESWATPTARDFRDGTDPTPKVPTKSILGRQAPRWTGQEYPSGAGPRRLNPVFVEWLMGWPLGWTDFAPVGTEWFRWQRHMRSELLRLHWQDA